MPRFYLSRYRRRSVRSDASVDSAGTLFVRFPFSFLTFLIVALGVLSLLYVWQVTLLATQGYERGRLEAERASLEQQLETLAMKTLDEQTLARVEERVRESNFVRDDHPVYVSAEELARSITLR